MNSYSLDEMVAKTSRKMTSLEIAKKEFSQKFRKILSRKNGSFEELLEEMKQEFPSERVLYGLEDRFLENLDFSKKTDRDLATIVLLKMSKYQKR